MSTSSRVSCPTLLRATTQPEVETEAAPAVPVFRYHLGLALSRDGQSETAVSVLSELLANAGDFPERDDAKALLADVRELVEAQKQREAAALQ